MFRRSVSSEGQCVPEGQCVQKVSVLRRSVCSEGQCVQKGKSYISPYNMPRSPTGGVDV